LKDHWGISLLVFLLLIIIAVSVKPGKLILGNDNFSPELNPALTLQRSLSSPAFRTYRVLGLPSDSEQADVLRTSLFFVLKPILPTWILSQGYLFFTFFIAIFSMAALCGGLLSQIIDKKVFQKAFFFGGLFYMSNMLTSWIYFFPVQLFVAAYAFLPFVLWRLYAFYRKTSVRNAFSLLIASLFLSTSALTATLFLVCAVVIFIFACVLFVLVRKEKNVRTRVLLAGLFIIFAIQSYWVFPFITYVKTNAAALRDSAINRDITATTIENEVKYDTALNSIRYYASWIDTKENNVDYTFPYRNWYVESPLATIISFFPVILAILGTLYGYKKSKPILTFSLLAFLGWWGIKGVNPPLGIIYDYLQNTFPIAAQVFRWQSSKLWPLLAATMPILAVFGIIQLGEFIERFKKYGRKIALLLFGAIAVALILFVYPYFFGGLVRGSVFTNVPNEYFQLAEYLSVHDKFSRIYVAPEANTLYFRNYSWGFWGSVVLNYILPNPIIEKALTIGSYENEQAFTVIRGAYYSQDPLRFVNALNLYNTPYILSDKYASKGSVGYVYDWSVNKKVVEDNPYLGKVWQQGKLTLYKVKNLKKPSYFMRVFPQTDFTKLNMILSSQALEAYYTQDSVPGRIYPFALSFDSLSFGKDEIVGSLINKQNDGAYQMDISSDGLANAPTQIIEDATNKKILFYPITPYLQIDKIKYIYSLPHKSYLVDTLPSFVSIDGQVVDFANDLGGLRSVDTLYKDITSDRLVQYWSSLFTTQSFSVGSNQISCDRSLANLALGDSIKCVTTGFSIAKDSVLELKIGLKTSSLTRATVCVYSDYKKICLNKNSTAFINGSNISTLSIPSVVQQGDKITIFVNFQTQASSVNLTTPDLSLKIYSDNKLANFESETASKTSSFAVSIKKGDTITFHIPVTNGQSSWFLSSEGAYIPETSFNNSNIREKVKENNNGGFTIINQGNNVSVFPKLSFLDPQGGLGFLAIAGEHKNGIPLNISLRDQNQQYNLWQRELFYKQRTNSIDLFPLPNLVETYSLETSATGIGPRESVNVLNNLVFESIPASWYNLVLIPNSETSNSISELSPSSSEETNTYAGNINQTNSIISIPIAYSPNWNLSIDDKNSFSKAILINGWQQGWVLEKSGNVKVWFWPNMLVYLGFIPLGVAIGLPIWYLGKIGLRKAINFSSKKVVQI